jgi:eukaryotic-like serine/threonine-protein kinase
MIEEQLAEGATIAERYTLSKLLGEGGMGAVWSARHVVTGKRLALKFLKGTQDDHRRRFVQEARVAAAIRHPNVIDIHDVFALPDGQFVLVMDLLDGEPLSALLHRQRRLLPEELMPMALEVLAGLGAAHAAGVVHRDMKPDNIFLCRSSNGQLTVKLLDFGIAKLSALESGIEHSGAMTQTGSLLGTPIYMAPEQVFGEKNIDHRADFWALGIVLYECLTGACPIEGENIGQIFKMISTHAFPPLSVRMPALDMSIVAMIDKMLSISPDDRPDSAGEIAKVFAARMGLAEPHIPEPIWASEARRKSLPVQAPYSGEHGSEQIEESSISLHPTLAIQHEPSDAPTFALVPEQKTLRSSESERPLVWRWGLFAFVAAIVLGFVLYVRANSVDGSTSVNAPVPSPSFAPMDSTPSSSPRESMPLPASSIKPAENETPLSLSASGSPASSTASRNRPSSKSPPKSSSAPTATSDSNVKLGPGGIYSDSPY